MKENKTKKLVINSLLLGIGLILHQITPTLGLPMQPDFALAMLFIVMIINNYNYKTSLIAGIVIGLFTALTTKFPGGQLPNIIDKIITVNIVYLISILINKLGQVKKGLKTNKLVSITMIMAIGTLVSGTVFLGSAYLIVGLPGGFNILFMTVVIPAVIINSIIGVILYRIVETSLKKIALS